MQISKRLLGYPLFDSSEFTTTLKLIDSFIFTNSRLEMLSSKIYCAKINEALFLARSVIGHEAQLLDGMVLKDFDLSRLSEESFTFCADEGWIEMFKSLKPAQVIEISAYLGKYCLLEIRYCEN